jgi:hypothetical protein
VFGNLLEEPADGILNGKRMRNLRRALSQKRLPDINIWKACDAPWQGSYWRL